MVHAGADTHNTEVDKFEARLAQITEGHTNTNTNNGIHGALWLSHHWPPQYHERCLRVGRHWVCRRCAVLYPVALITGLITAMVSSLGPWTYDLGLIVLCSIPATLAYCGEAMGWFRYQPKVQTVTMAIAAVGIGRGLGHEFLDRWSPMFWLPLGIFGSVWFGATVANWRANNA